MLFNLCPRKNFSFFHEETLFSGKKTEEKNRGEGSLRAIYPLLFIGWLNISLRVYERVREAFFRPLLSRTTDEGEFKREVARRARKKRGRLLYARLHNLHVRAPSHGNDAVIIISSCVPRSHYAREFLLLDGGKFGKLLQKVVRQSHDFICHRRALMFFFRETVCLRPN